MTGMAPGRQLGELFREVGEAHHQACIETNGADPEWLLWYADYVLYRLAPLLGFTRSELWCIYMTL